MIIEIIKNNQPMGCHLAARFYRSRRFVDRNLTPLHLYEMVVVDMSDVDGDEAPGFSGWAWGVEFVVLEVPFDDLEALSRHMRTTHYTTSADFSLCRHNCADAVIEALKFCEVDIKPRLSCCSFFSCTLGVGCTCPTCCGITNPEDVFTVLECHESRQYYSYIDLDGTRKENVCPSEAISHFCRSTLSFGAEQVQIVSYFPNSATPRNAMSAPPRLLGMLATRSTTGMPKEGFLPQIT